jgi:hypothetical protein
MAQRKSRLIFMVVASLALLWGARECYIRVRINGLNAKINSLKIGMPESDVMRILGGPGHAEEVSHVPGADELFEIKSPFNKGDKSGLNVLKRNYMILWYREFLISGGRTYISVETFFSLETRRLLSVRRFSLTVH